ncbi:hypothetical protein I4U23_004251 [Adineta vaga]|nr:hypothetical protein I4U23_004251 [Adineta vaga]
MLDLSYFSRQIFSYFRHKISKSRVNILDDVIIHSRCRLNDLDFNWHMNNSRFILHCDFGRFKYLLQTGLWDAVVERRKAGFANAFYVVSAFQGQYRHSIGWNDRFQVVSRLHGWDDKAFYMEQLIILEKNQKIAFSLLGRCAVIPRTLTPQMIIDDLYHKSIQSPKLPSTIENFKENYQLNLSKTSSSL